MNKTTLIINEFAAADKLEEEMKRFGLEVDRGTFTGTYPGTPPTCTTSASTQRSTRSKGTRN